MILLVSTSDKMQLTTSSTANVDVHASYMDAPNPILPGSTITPGNKNTAFSSATTADIVAAPGASVVRNVKNVEIRNKHATTSNTVTVTQINASATVELIKMALLAGETLTYDEGQGWCVTDASGGKKVTPAPGRLLAETVLTSGTTFTTGMQTNTIKIRMVGGGAGGAGCTSVAAAAAGGGGGGAGGYLEKVVAVSPNTTYTVQVGAAGNGSSGAAGGNATDSTFIVGATTYTAKGGTGAVVATALTTLFAYAGGTGGTVSTNGDVNGGGADGEMGLSLIVATPIIIGGAGASSPFGGGGPGRTTVGNGNNATGFGAGGGGSATGASAVRTGGNGTAGVIIVEELS